MRTSDQPGSGDKKDKPEVAHKNVNWDVYDVPRIWMMVQGEGNREAEDLVMAFNKISQYVDDTRLRLTDVAKQLALGWSGSAAADGAQAQITEVVNALQTDVTAYVTATRELENVISRLAEAKASIRPLHDQWQLLSRLPASSGIFTSVLVESDVYQDEVQQTNEAARDEMRRLDRDLSGARITPTEEFVPSGGMPSSTDLELAGLAPQAVAAVRGGPGGGPGGASLMGAAGGVGIPAMPGVIGGGDTTRPAAGGMMGGGMGGGGGGGGGAGAGGKANLKWSARSGVDPVIDGAPAPDPSTMGVDDSFEKDQRRKK